MPNEDFHKQHTQPWLIQGATSPELPDCIGPYKIEALLHQGRMSLLYMGIHPNTKKPIAIKVLPSEAVQDEEAIQRFLQESHMISTVDHTNIVKLYGEGSWEGGLYIAMEWIYGNSVRQLITEKTLSLKKALHLLLQIGKALQHLHSLSIVHRDLKPENILVSPGGIIKIIDFGISRVMKEPHFQLSATLSGTPNYMSPEQKETPHIVSPLSDIYALGVLAYELSTGELSYGVIQTALLPKHLRKIITKAIAVSPKERYQSVEEFMQEVSAYLHSKEIDKEKPKQDQIKEVFELFQTTANAISPFHPPKWNKALIGMATIPFAETFALYYDLFLLPDDSYLIFMGELDDKQLSSLFPVIALRSVIHTKIRELATLPFSLDSFISSLEKHKNQDVLLADFSISALHLDATAQKLHFFNAGINPLFLIQNNRKSRILSSPATVVTEDWKVGDTLLFHSFRAEPKWIDSHTKKLSKRKLLAQSFADTFLKEAHLSLQDPGVLFCIQRT